MQSYLGNETVTVYCSTTLTNFTLQIFVKKTYGATYNGYSITYQVGTVTPSFINNATYLIYTVAIVSGQTITCSDGPFTYIAEFHSNGTAQVTSSDTYILTATTSSGVTNILSGHF
jgi:hypothetical protein